jgi:hypothetical protein
MYESSESMRWRSLVLRSKSDPEVEEELRGLCEHGAWLSPDLARDVVFWLDIGLPPRTVEHWLCGELMSDPGGAFLVQARDAEPPSPRSPGPTGNGRRPRFFRRRTTKVE